MAATANNQTSHCNDANVTKKIVESKSSNVNPVKKVPPKDEVITFERLDIDSLKLAFPLNNEDVLINVLQRIEPSLEFKKQGNRFLGVGDKSLNLYSKNDNWFCHDFSAKYPSGDAYQLTAKHLNTNYQDKDSLFAHWEFIANANRSNIHSYITTEARKNTDWKKARIERDKLRMQREIDSIAKQSAQSKTVFAPNETSKAKQNYDYEIASWSSDLGIAVLKYWSEKLPSNFEYLTTGEKIEFLERNGVYPCKWTQKKGVRRKFHYNPSNIGILHISGETVKLKTPYAKPFIGKDGKKKTIKWATLVSANNYTFGVDNLPKEKVKLILIASGESDTLTYNLTHNETCYYAISFGSEKASLSNEVVNYLRSRCEALAVCYDGDETGLKNAKKLNTQHNLPYLNLDMGTGEKVDLCTLSQRSDFCVTMYHKTNEAFFTKYIERNELDPFSIGDIQAVRIPTKRYAGDNINVHPINGLTPYEMYVEQLVKYSRLNFFAKPGLGKSWLNIALSTDKEALARIDVARTIFCVPTTAILEQLENDLKEKAKKENRTIDYIVINGETDISDIQDAYFYDIILTTHNSAHKVLDLAKNAVVVIDESHELRNTKGYKDGTQRSEIKANRHAFALVESARKGVLVSATPLLELSKVKDYQLVICESEQNQRHVLQQLHYSKAKKTGLIRDIDKRVNLSEGKHIVKLNSVDTLEAFRASLLNQHPNLRTEILSSKKSEYKASNTVYQSIMNTGRLPIGIDNIVILTTSLMDTGVSFRFKVDSVTVIEPDHHQALIQFINRPRMFKDANGETVNEVIKVYAYNTNNDTSETITDSSIIDYIQSNYSNAEYNCKWVNTYFSGKGNQDAQKKYYQDREHYYYSKSLEKYIVDLTGVLYDAYLLESDLYRNNTKAMYERIKFENPFITVLNSVYTDLENDKIVAENLTKAKRIAKTDKITSIKIVKSDSVKIEGTNITTTGVNALVSIVYHTTQNQDLKRNISKLTNSGACANVITPKVFKDVKDEIIKGIGVANIEALEKPMERITKLTRLGVPIDKSIELIDYGQTEQKFNILYNTIVAQSEYRRHIKGKELKAFETKRTRKYKAIIKAMPKNANRRVFTKDSLIELVKKAINREKVSFDFALSSIMELYEVKRTTKKVAAKKVRVIEVGLLHSSKESKSIISRLFDDFGAQIMENHGDSYISQK